MNFRSSDFRPLSELIPDPDRFWADPAASLSRTPITIGPYRPVRATIGYALVCVAFWIMPEFHDLVWCGRLILPVVLGVILVAQWWPAQEMVLDRTGLEIRRGRKAIRCPWGLFAAPGAPSSEKTLIYLRLPCRLDRIPWVEHYCDGCFTGYGASTTIGALHFRPAGAVLDARYEINMRDLGELLLRLGRRLGGQTPLTGPVPGGGDPDVVAPPDIVVRRSGWFVFRRVGMRLPRVCCRCDRAADAALKVSVSDRLSKYAGWLLHFQRWIAVPVPICRACQVRSRRIGIAAGLVAAIGTAVLATCAFVFDPGPPRLNPLTFPVIVIGDAALFGWLGFCAAGRIVNGRFVQPGTFSDRGGTVSLRFRRPGFVRRVLEIYEMSESGPCEYESAAPIVAERDGRSGKPRSGTEGSAAPSRLT